MKVANKVTKRSEKGPCASENLTFLMSTLYLLLQLYFLAAASSIPTVIMGKIVALLSALNYSSIAIAAKTKY